MVRGTFANVRLRNMLVEREGNWSKHFPDGEEASIFETAEKYMNDGIPTIILAGREYGTGSSRDWAAKGPYLQGVKAVIAQSFERIHRSNLIGMGVLPLQFKDGATAESLGLKGDEVFDITGIEGSVKAGQDVSVKAMTNDGKPIEFTVLCRIDTPVEADYYLNGGIMQYVIRQLLDE
jgi:aconitate hydratase